MLEIIADEVRLVIEDELALERLGALGRHGRVCRLGLRHVVEVAKHVVHGQESRRHAAARAEELAPVQTLFGTVLVRQFHDARFHLPLLGRLR